MRTLITLLLAATAAFAQKAPGFDPGSLSRAIDPCENFYKFACGGWMAANPLPNDQARFGRFDALQERNRTVLQNILETASSKKARRSSLEQKVGDFYAACMDDKGINARGLASIKPELDRINAIKTRAEVPDVVTRLFLLGVRPFFNVGSEQDPKESTKVIVAVDQGGFEGSRAGGGRGGR